MGDATADRVTLRLLDEAWTLLADHGHGDGAAAIRARLDAEAQAVPTVVVVGEAKRGKSSLVNALLGAADLAPVGADLTTAAYVAYLPATSRPGSPHEDSSDLAPGAARIHFADRSHEDVPAGTLADWVTVSGKHVTESRGVVGATVRPARPGPLDLVLMDTPGVSGLVAGHGQLALRMARQATALLFVTDAGQELTAPEKAFLEQAAESVDTVVFALTKIDKHPVSWQSVLDRNRQLLAQHAPRFTAAPMVGVSGELALEALRVDDPEVSQALHDESRVSELVSALGGSVAARAGRLSTANAVRATATVLRTVEDDLAERVAAVNDAEAAGSQATAEQEALQSLRRRQQQWGEHFQLAMSRARRSLVQDLEKEVIETDSAWRRRVAALPDRQLRDQQQIVAACGELAAKLEDSTTRLMGGYLDEVGRHVADLLEEDAVRTPALVNHILAVVQDTATGGDVPYDPTAAPAQRVGEHVVRNAFMGFGAANVVGMVVGATLGPFLIPVAAATALALTFTTHQRQKGDVARRQLTEHVTKTVGRLRGDVLGRADAVAHELRPSLLQAMRDHLAEREAQLSTVIEDARQAARSAPMERLKKAQALGRQLKSAAAARAELEAWLERDAAHPPPVTPRPEPAVDTRRQGVTSRPRNDW